MDTVQKAALYARVSSQEQAVEGVSMEAQVAALRAYVKSQGWEVVDEYIEMAGTAAAPTKDPH